MTIPLPPEEDTPGFDPSTIVNRRLVPDDSVECPKCQTRYGQTWHKLCFYQGKHYWRVTWVCCGVSKAFLYSPSLGYANLPPTALWAHIQM